VTWTREEELYRANATYVSRPKVPNLLPPPIREKLPLKALDVHADVVPKDQTLYRMEGSVSVEMLFRPLR
jgi:hypothetical protein